MDEKVKAAVLVEPGHVETWEFDMPKLGKGAAICKVIRSGICGTDKHSYRGEAIQYKGTENEIRLPFPIIQGHEVLLEIAAIDEDGAKNLSRDGDILKVGDRVTICPDVVCGKCWYCKNIPSYPWCEHLRFSYGNMRSCNDANHLYGGAAQYLYIEPGTYVYKVPDGLTEDMACFTEVMCVAYTLEKARQFSAQSREGFNLGDSVVVQGVGPLGMAHVIMARIMGAGKIIATDISDYKLELAREFGADVVINVRNTTAEERIARIKQETHGRGADIVCECVGRPEAFPEGLRYLRKAGMYLEPGNFVECGEAPRIGVHEICANNLRIVGMSNHISDYQTVMQIMLRNKDRFPWEKLFSHHFPVEDYETAIRTSMTDESMKVVVDPWM